MLRTYARRVAAAIAAQDVTKAHEEAKTATKKIDQAASRGLIHRNKAARLKSRMQRRLKALKQADSATS